MNAIIGDSHTNGIVSQYHTVITEIHIITKLLMNTC